MSKKKKEVPYPVLLSQCICQATWAVLLPGLDVASVDMSPLVHSSSRLPLTFPDATHHHNTNLLYLLASMMMKISKDDAGERRRGATAQKPSKF